jgi:soluble cytochrome b562
MSRHVRGMLYGSAFALIIGLMAYGPRTWADAEDEKEIKEAQKDTLELAKAIEEGKNGKDIAARMKKKYSELNTVMQAFKPTTKKGIGTNIGAKGAGDGIEAKIISLGRKAPSKDALEKQKAALLKMAYINLAIAEVTKLYPPGKPKGGKGVKEWQQYTTEMTKSTKEMIDAIKKGDSAKVKEAANNLNNACNSCHTDFRDN